MKVEESGRGDSPARFTLTQVLAGLLPLVVAVAGATFAIVKLATDSHVSALQLQVTLLDTRVRELQAELQRRQLLMQTPAQSGGASTKSKPPTDQEQAIVLKTPPKPSTSEKLAIVLKTPAAESEVAQFVDVNYSVVGTIPADYKPVLFVKDPLGQYWSWGSSSSGYHPSVQVGVATDVGRRFEIGVLITRETVPFGKGITSLPAGLAYEAITVKRK